MANMGIPVPPGFTITTETSVDYLRLGAFPEGLFETVRKSLVWLERGTGKRTSPEDLHGMKVAQGILTARGGATSHAAVVARGMGRPCVAGCGALHVDYEASVMAIHAADGSVVASMQHGALITIDGSSGQVYLGAVETVDVALGSEMELLLTWTDRVRRMRVRTNADTPATF
jgi:phosphoenolpyruvate synthase/pyruvate phosphate dikinase